jgi:hypothetical protein
MTRGDMTFPLRLALNGMVRGEHFDGVRTHRALEKHLGAFARDLDLSAHLEAWANELLGPDVFDGVDRTKWRFVRLDAGQIGTVGAEKPKIQPRGNQRRPHGTEGSVVNTWIFQGNPDQFDIDTHLRRARRITWTVGQVHLAASMKPGDRVFLWRAGGKRRVLGVSSQVDGYSNRLGCRRRIEPAEICGEGNGRLARLCASGCKWTGWLRPKRSYRPNG